MWLPQAQLGGLRTRSGGEGKMAENPGWLARIEWYEEAWFDQTVYGA